jgi:eukaryotic-like serine/threonine-protein kinase
MDVRTGNTDPGNNSAGDDQIVNTYKKVSDSDSEKTEGSRKIFDGFDQDAKYQYILVFLTDLPPADDGRGGYKVSVTDIAVYGV